MSPAPASVREPRRATILISSAGRRVHLIECFRADAERLGIALDVVAVDVEPTMSAACQVADRAHAVPRCTTAEFVPALLDICRAESVDLLIPTIDPELQPLSDHAAAFHELGTVVSVSAPDVVALARDKLRTAEFLDRQGLPTPATWAATGLGEQPPQPFEPLILKPRHGSSSAGVERIALPEQWPGGRELQGYVGQRLLDGDEYTVNLFFARSGGLRAAVPHLRHATRGGEVSKGVTRRQPSLIALARALGRALPGARGALCFQAIVSATGAAAIFEINARFGGGYPLAHRAGACFSQWLLEEALGWPSSAADSWREGVVMLRYDAAVFRTDG